MQEILKTRQEAYLNWMCGADHDLIAAELKTINAYLFSKEADAIEKASYTIYGEELHGPTLSGAALDNYIRGHAGIGDEE